MLPKRASCRVAGQNKKDPFNLLSLELGHHESNECREKVKFYKNKLTQGFFIDLRRRKQFSKIKFKNFINQFYIKENLTILSKKQAQDLNIFLFCKI